MLFNSLSFFVYFVIVAGVYYLLPAKIRYIWLLIASYFFYMQWNAKYGLLLFAVTVVTYTGGLIIEKIKNANISENRKVKLKKGMLVVTLLVDFGILCYFKYMDFVAQNLNFFLSKIGSTARVAEFDILLPVGISFFVFQAVSYTIDVYRNQIYAEKNFFRYALFVSFFPQLVAGPIERSKNLLVQLKQEHRFSFERARDGLLLMLWGYFLKIVVADRLAIFVDTVYNGYTKYEGWYLTVASVFFAFQIYCDFSGYSTIAMGVAKILGFDLIDNFEAPYLSLSTSEFWRRWHISLSSWFKDYVYIPLGGNRKGTIRKYINLMIVFLTSGLWHGAAWKYVAWGG